MKLSFKKLGYSPEWSNLTTPMDVRRVDKARVKLRRGDLYQHVQK